MNKYNIEVGDTIKLTGTNTIVGVVVRLSDSDKDGDIKCYFKSKDTGEEDWGYIEYYEPVVKVSKSKIIGYTLLKDTPEFDVGTKFFADDYGDYTKEGENKEDSEHYYKQKDVELKPHFFKPIYEEVKPTEVFVDTLAGKVKVTKAYLALNNGDMLRVVDFSKVVQELQSIKGSYNSYELKVETFKLGCQLFHVDSILKLQAAIKEVE